MTEGKRSSWRHVSAVLTMLVLLLVGASAGADEPPRPERPDDPWMPGTGGAAAAARPLRGSAQSVQVNVDSAGFNILGDAANEPSIAVDPTAPNRIVIGWRQFDTVSSDFRQAGHAYSKDGGRSWTFPGVIQPGVFRSDPVLAADAEGHFYYYSLTIRDVFVCDLFVSGDGGMTWGGAMPAFGGDKAWMVIDQSAGSGLGNIYAYWSSFFSCCGQDIFTRSLDGGGTFLGPSTISPNPIFGTMAVASDGTVFAAGAVPGDYSTFRVSRTSDATNMLQIPTFESVDVDLGGSMTFSSGPNPGGLLGQAYVDVDRSDGPTAGNVYLLCSVNPPNFDPLEVRFARSEDGGATWSDPVTVNSFTTAGLTPAWQWFGTMSVAPNGRIDVVWNDTRNDPTTTFSELYYAFSTDGGVSWSANEPLSPPFNHFLGYPQQNKLGDYYHMVSDDVGAHLAWAATFNGEQDVYYLRIGDYDCNGNAIGDTEDLAARTSADCNENGIPDECEIAAGAADDEDGNGIPDECEMEISGDVNGDGVIDVLDLIEVITSWGPCPGCATDVDGSGAVDVLDLIAVISAWTV